MDVGLSTSFWEGDYLEPGTGYPDLDPNTAPCLQAEAGSFARYFGPAVFSAVFVVGLVGNGLVLAVLGQWGARWRFADYCLFQLAVADLLLVLTLPFRAAQFTQGWRFGGFLCKAVGALATMNVSSSVLLLTALSLERYLAIVHARPLHLPGKAARLHLASLLLWAVCLALSGADLHLRTAAYLPPAGAVVCHLAFEAPDSESWRLLLRLLSFLLGFWLPLLVMSYCCGRILTWLHRAGLLSWRLPLRPLGVIWLLFIACWGPFHCLVLVDSLQRLGHWPRDCRQEQRLDFGLLVTESLGLIHCCLNPLVYAFGGVRFRRGLLRWFCGPGGSNRDQPPSSSQEGSQAPEPSTVQGLDYSLMM